MTINDIPSIGIHHFIVFGFHFIDSLNVKNVNKFTFTIFI